MSRPASREVRNHTRETRKRKLLSLSRHIPAQSPTDVPVTISNHTGISILEIPEVNNA